jgi:hypothetical protein
MDDWETSARRIVIRDDLRGYSGFSPVEHGAVLAALARARRRAERRAGLDRSAARVQTTGDGELSCWPVGTNILTVLDHYLPALYRELEDVNRPRAANQQIRLRLAVVEEHCAVEGDVITEAAPISATRLVDSVQCRNALRDYPLSSLAVVIDDGIYRNVVAGGQALRGSAWYSPFQVDQPEKGFGTTAWLTVFDDNVVHLNEFPLQERRSRRRKSGRGHGHNRALGWNPSPSPVGAWPRPSAPVMGVTVALAATLSAIGVLVSQPSGAGAMNSGPDTILDMRSAVDLSPAEGVAAVWPEQAVIKDGAPLFSNTRGAQADGGARIPYGDWVDVSCFAPGSTGTASRNVLYLIADGRWSGDYAPASTFTNGDPLDVPNSYHDVDSRVPSCS